MPSEAQIKRVKVDEKFRKKFSKNFSSEMKRLEITNADISKACKIHTAQVAFWIKGTRVPSIRNLAIIYKKFPDLDIHKLVS